MGRENEIGLLNGEMGTRWFEFFGFLDEKVLRILTVYLNNPKKVIFEFSLKKNKEKGSLADHSILCQFHRQDQSDGTINVTMSMNNEQYSCFSNI